MTTDTPLLPGHYYHIYNRGNNGANIFFEERNYHYFLKLYATHIEPVADTFAYCLLRNHFHFSVRIRTDEERHNWINQTGANQTGAVSKTAPVSNVADQTGAVSKTAPVSNVADQTGAVSKTAPVSPGSEIVLKPPHRHFNNMFIAYAKAINKAYQRTGSLMEKPFKRKLVDNERYFAQLITYIHQNPQKHGFVDDFRDWPWSSYHTLTTPHPTRLNRDAVLNWFEGSRNFIKTHQTPVNITGIEPLVEGDWF